MIQSTGSSTRAGILNCMTDVFVLASISQIDMCVGVALHVIGEDNYCNIPG